MHNKTKPNPGLLWSGIVGPVWAHLWVRDQLKNHLISIELFAPKKKEKKTYK